VGLVVGLDVGDEALAGAGDAIAAQSRFSNIHLVQGDINALAPDALAAWQPFDFGCVGSRSCTKRIRWPRWVPSPVCCGLLAESSR
jgi:hypothetical protein